MYLEIVSPETTLFKGEVDSVSVPGINGDFEMLNNHAPIVSILKEGFVKIRGNISIDEENEVKPNDNNDNYDKINDIIEYSNLIKQDFINLYLNKIDIINTKIKFRKIIS